MKRIPSQVKITEKQTRWITTFEADPSELGTPEDRTSLLDLLSVVGGNPTLVSCGPVMFDRAAIYHNGSCWVFKSEAVVVDP